jgi:hypothetical protein
MIIVLFVAFGSLVGHGVYIYIVAKGVELANGIGQFGVTQYAKNFRIIPSFYENIIMSKSHHWFLMIAVLLLAGAGIIANDRKFNALQIYFSKPVNFWDYIFGKFLTLALYCSAVTVVPCLLLFIFRILLARDTAYLRQYFWIPFSLIGYFIIIVTTFGLFIMAISAISRSNRSVAISFFAALIFPDFLRQILSRIPEVGLFSLNANLRQVGSILFGLEQPHVFPLWVSILVIASVIIACIAILRMRIRPTEVVR